MRKGIIKVLCVCVHPGFMSCCFCNKCHLNVFHSLCNSGVSAVRDSVPRLQYGRKNLQGNAVVGRSSVDGALITCGGARARYFLAFLVNNDGDSVMLFFRIKNDLLPYKRYLLPYRRRVRVSKA